MKDRQIYLKVSFNTKGLLKTFEVIKVNNIETYKSSSDNNDRIGIDLSYLKYIDVDMILWINFIQPIGSYEIESDITKESIYESLKEWNKGEYEVIIADKSISIGRL